MTNSQDLITRFQQKDYAAFKEVFKLFSKDISYFAFKMVNNKQEAEDVSIHAFVQLHLHSHTFTGLANIRAYLFNVARNACFNYLRDRKRQLQREKLLPLLIEDEIPLEDRYQREELYALIFQAIDKLPKRTKIIFKMIYIEGLKVKEIASQLQIQETTVRRQKQIALKRLKSLLLNRFMVI